MEEEIIEAVRPNTMLYDTKNSDYMRPKVKQEIWNGIARDLNLSNGDEVKSIWTKLRSCHRDALRRQQKYFRGGTPIESIKKWRYQKQMQFLLPYMMNRTSDQPFQGSDDEDSQSQSKNADPLVTENVEEFDMEESTNYDEMTEINEDDEEISIKSEYTSECERNMVDQQGPSLVNTRTSKPPVKKMKVRDNSVIMQRSIGLREQRFKERADERLEDSRTTNDPLWHFFVSMYQTTNKMPPECQHFVKTKIFEAVSETEASLFNT